jgi:gamma-glutamylcyclotransferase (GGCT)/AIG2-like uncharacterized protein YtfP
MTVKAAGNVLQYFAYGTTQQGFTHHRRLAALLGEPIARVRTVLPHAIVVPWEPACSNPGCEYLHRMAALVPGFAPLRAEGDLFSIAPETLCSIDELESGAYIRTSVAVESPGSTWTAQAYVIRSPERWHALVDAGHADALAAYPRELAAAEQRKACCVRAPGHPPPHDTQDPLSAL